MNQIIYDDFKLFKDEALDVDYITFNIRKPTNLEENDLVTLFQSLKFYCYKQKTQKTKRKMALSTFGYKFEVCLISEVPYQNAISQLQFSGSNANQFYKLIKQNGVPWEKFRQFDFVLNRFDLVYERKNKFQDRIDPTEFISSSFQYFQNTHPNKNLQAIRNQKGLLLKIGNRKTQRHYRIYSSNNNKSLRFEAELKGDIIKDFHHLLTASKFVQKEFEIPLSYLFFKYSFQLFGASQEFSHLDWLMNRIRPLQFKQKPLLDQSSIYSHYFNKIDFHKYELQKKKKKDLITLLRLLIYLQIKDLDYEVKSLTSDFRLYVFPISDFITFNYQNHNQYQIKKVREFLDDVVENKFIIKSFTDKYYRILVTIPEAFGFKQSNRWMAQVWIADELFDYLHPFLFKQFFTHKIKKNEFLVLFEIIKVFSSSDIKKEYDIQAFFDNSGIVFSNQQKTEIRNYFVKYLQELHQQKRIQDQVMDLSSKQVIPIHELNKSHSRIAVFEIIDVKFIS